MASLIEFLLARIAEDEAIATRYPAGDHTRWPLEWIRDEHQEDALEISTARVLAECAVKRELIDHDGTEDYCHACERPGPCYIRVLIASLYSDHPDYQPNWTDH
jgi:hypothetical protein